jgi:hypothetical protein
VLLEQMLRSSFLFWQPSRVTQLQQPTITIAALRISIRNDSTAVQNRQAVLE